MNRQKELCDELRLLQSKLMLTQEDEAFAVQALSGKWYGVQVCAAKVVSKRMGQRALPILKHWLAKHRDNREMLGQAQRALAGIVTQEDLPWIWDEYLKNPGDYALFLIAACMRFPDPQVAAQIAEDVRKGGESSTVVLAAVPFPNRQLLFDALLSDPALPNRSFVQRCQDWPTVSIEQTLLSGW